MITLALLKNISANTMETVLTVSLSLMAFAHLELLSFINTFLELRSKWNYLSI